MTPAEALARIAAHCDELETDAHPGRLIAQVRAVLAEVTPEPGGTLDRDQARDVLRSAYRDNPSEDPEGFEGILDRLAACVRPATIDRDALERLVMDARYSRGNRWTTEKFADAILALVRPVAGVTLAGDERIEALEALKPVLGRLEGETHWRAPAVRALVERLEATR